MRISGEVVNALDLVPPSCESTYLRLFTSQVTIDQVIGGARGIKSMIWETSNLDPDEVSGFKHSRFVGGNIPQGRRTFQSTCSSTPAIDLSSIAPCDF